MQLAACSNHSTQSFLLATLLYTYRALIKHLATVTAKIPLPSGINDANKFHDYARTSRASPRAHRLKWSVNIVCIVYTILALGGVWLPHRQMMNAESKWWMSTFFGSARCWPYTHTQDGARAAGEKKCEKRKIEWMNDGWNKCQEKWLQFTMMMRYEAVWLMAAVSAKFI